MLPIREMPSEERPRERLHRLGAAALREAELLAILLRTGVRGSSAVDVAETLLQKSRGLAGLSQMPLDEIAHTKGIGSAKAIQIKAAIELGARLSRCKIIEDPLDTPQRVMDLLGDEMRPLNQEEVRVVLLNTRLRVVSVEVVTRGILDQAMIHPRELFGPALSRRAHAIILVHNHPSGDPTPSEADLHITKRMAEVAKVLEIRLADHVIIGRSSDAFPGGFFSFRSAGHL